MPELPHRSFLYTAGNPSCEYCGCEIVEATTWAVQCEECGKRCASPSTLKAQRTKLHDGAGQVLREADPADFCTHITEPGGDA